MAFAKEKFNSDGSLKSGLNADDLWNHVLDKMFEYLKQNTTEVENDDDNDEDDEGGNEAPGVRPSTWYFRGFWTFQLFGPLAPLTEKSPLFNVDSLDALSQGRAAIRAKNAKNKKVAAFSSSNADAATSPSGFKRGIGIKEKAAIVHLSQQEKMASTRDDELEFEAIRSRIVVVKDELNFALAIVRELRLMDKEDEDAWKTVIDLSKRSMP
jgi:hypothetical protein